MDARTHGRVRIIATVHGRVTGVGFRDYVVGRAALHPVAGTVHNTRARDTVEIDVEGAPRAVEAFLADVEANARHPARIERIERRADAPRGAAGFRRIATP